MRSRPSETPPAPESSPRAAVEACRADATAIRELRGLYRRADAAVAATGAACLGGGACCKFDLAAHRLFVTTAELALLSMRPPPRLERCGRRRCPYQRGPRCTARRRRPLGCRTYFCDASRAETLRKIHETFHGEVRRLHRRRGIPYVYLELTAAIRRAAESA